MYPKRFIQLFLIFLITIFISLFIVDLFHITGFLPQAVVLTVVGYIILIIPLTILTILKQKKKFRGVEKGSQTDVFQSALTKMENVLVLATQSEKGHLTASIITFKQSASQENIFYLVTGAETERVANIIHNGIVAFTTWYNKEDGLRVSSKEVTAKIIRDHQQIQETVQQHPEIKMLSDNFSNQVIIQLTINAALIESFRDNPQAVSFQVND